MQNLTRQLRCTVCQNQSLYDSNAPLAEDLKLVVNNMLLDNKTDNEVMEFLSYRYGDFILYEPPKRSDTALLWLGPVLLLILGGVLVWRSCRG